MGKNSVSQPAIELLDSWSTNHDTACCYFYFISLFICFLSCFTIFLPFIYFITLSVCQLLLWCSCSRDQFKKKRKWTCWRHCCCVDDSGGWRLGGRQWTQASCQHTCSHLLRADIFTRTWSSSTSHPPASPQPPQTTPSISTFRFPLLFLPVARCWEREEGPCSSGGW